MQPRFAKPSSSKSELEEGPALSPRFNSDGLITAVVVDNRDKAVLMLAQMNDEALRLTLETGHAHFWSRSRGQLWKKGETSGNLLEVQAVHLDCDQDAVLLHVTVAGDGAACHTGRRTCFYRRVDTGNDGEFRLVTETP